MKLVLDPRPYRTFSIQVTFDVGWRHEPIKMRGSMRKGLEDLVENIEFLLPKWFEVSYVMEPEFSSILIFGTSKDQDAILKILSTFELNLPEIYEDLNASLEMVVSSGGIKKEIVESFLDIDVKSRHKPEIVTKPRRFLDLKKLSRVQKHFFSHVFLERGGEVFLEVSKRGDRIHYGKNVPDIDISFSEEKELYKGWILRKWESTAESVKLITFFNVFSKEIIKLDEIFREIGELREEDFLEAVEILKMASRR